MLIFNLYVISVLVSGEIIGWFIFDIKLFKLVGRLLDFKSILIGI